MKRIASFLAFLTLSVALSAQSGTTSYPFAPDRPGASNSPYLVGIHQLDMEVGFGYNATDGPITKNYYNQTLFRYGAFKHLELRAEIDFGSTTIQNPDSNYYGVKAITLGVKVPIISGIKYLPDIAILGVVSLPKIGVAYNTSNYTPAFVVLLQKGFGNLSLGTNLGIFWDNKTCTGDPLINPYSIGNYAQGSYTAIVSYQIKKTSVFVESYGFYSNMTQPYFAGDIGVAYTPSSDLQLDLSMGQNINFDSYFIAVGFAWRIPNKYK